VKNLFVFLLVVAGAGLFFHDKQQTAALAKAQQDNDALNQQLTDKTSALTTAQARLQQLTFSQGMGSALQSPAQPPGPPAAKPSQWSGDSSSLDRPAYREGGGTR